jgi:hypothetical protein
LHKYAKQDGLVQRLRGPLSHLRLTALNDPSPNIPFEPADSTATGDNCKRFGELAFGHHIRKLGAAYTKANTHIMWPDNPNLIAIKTLIRNHF